MRYALSLFKLDFLFKIGAKILLATKYEWVQSYQASGGKHCAIGKLAPDLYVCSGV